MKKVLEDNPNLILIRQLQPPFPEQMVWSGIRELLLKLFIHKDANLVN